MTAQIIWQSNPIKVAYSHRKTIALHVKNGAVELRAPHDTPVQFSQEFVNTKDRWLRKTLAEQAERKSEQIDYGQSSTLPFMGLTISIWKEKSKKLSWRLTDQGVCLNQTDVDSADQSRQLLTSFYKKQAQFWLPKKTHKTTQKLGLESQLSDIRFRNTKSTWGHCTVAGRIQYNWLIMMAPEAVIDYLVAHETCHLQHLNHSKDFWQLVETIHPNYKHSKSWLRQQGHTLTLSTGT